MVGDIEEKMISEGRGGAKRLHVFSAYRGTYSIVFVSGNTGGGLFIVVRCTEYSAQIDRAQGEVCPASSSFRSSTILVWEP